MNHLSNALIWGESFDKCWGCVQLGTFIGFCPKLGIEDTERIPLGRV